MTLLAVAALILGSAPVSAQKVTIEYAGGFDFGSLQTYSLARTMHDDPIEQMIHDRTRFAIIRELHRGGLLTVSAEPDLHLEFRITSEDAAEQVVPRPTGPGWTAWGGRQPSAAASTPAGTLVIEAVDSETGELVWRGAGAVRVKAKAGPEKRLKKLDKAIAKIGKRWRKILAGEVP
jgi:hypothetical protein